ncbi:hypothetical protein BC832DRAFT_590887 [Gaertneriomyces semiglobifer]|nr:hypothetical protein BC832DRAFT_590887 [Gaertneriomyces semiglobifer]
MASSRPTPTSAPRILNRNANGFFDPDNSAASGPSYASSPTMSSSVRGDGNGVVPSAVATTPIDAKARSRSRPRDYDRYRRPSDASNSPLNSPPTPTTRRPSIPNNEYAQPPPRVTGAPMPSRKGSADSRSERSTPGHSRTGSSSDVFRSSTSRNEAARPTALESERRGSGASSARSTPRPSVSSIPDPSANQSFDDMLKALDDLHTRTAANPPRSAPLSPVGSPLNSVTSSNSRERDMRASTRSNAADYERRTSSADDLAGSRTNSRASVGDSGTSSERAARDRERDLERRRARERREQRESERAVRSNQSRENGAQLESSTREDTDRSEARSSQPQRSSPRAPRVPSSLAGPSTGSSRPSSAEQRASLMEQQEIARKNAERSRVEQERLRADQMEQAMVAETRARDFANERSRAAVRDVADVGPLPSGIRVDENVIVPDYVRALITTLQADRDNYPGPDDFLSSDGYSLWFQTVGMSITEVLTDLLKARFLESKPEPETSSEENEKRLEVIFKIVEARGLVAKEGRSREPYANLEWGPDDERREKRKERKVMRTEAMKDTLNPRWEQAVTIPVENPNHKVMVEVLDKVNQKHHLGKVKVSLSEIVPIAQREGVWRRTMQLTGWGRRDKDKYVGGEIVLEARIKGARFPPPEPVRPMKSPLDALLDTMQETTIDPRCLYRRLLTACLALDLNMLQITDSTTDLLTLESKNLLGLWSRLWGMSECSTVMVYLRQLFEKYKKYEVPMNSLLTAYERVKEGGKSRGWIRPDEKPGLVELFSEMDDYYRTQIVKYREVFPKNQPKRALETTILLLRMIFKNPIFREARRTLPESFREHLREFLTEALVTRYQKLKELTAPFDESDTASLLDGMTRLAELVMEEIEMDAKYFQKPFARELDIVRLTAEVYLKWLVLDLEGVQDVLGSSEAVDCSGSAWALYRVAREVESRYARLVPGMRRLSVNTGFNVERWFSPFISRWLEHLASRTLEWVSNATKADNFEPIAISSGAGGDSFHSSSIVDVFSAIFQELKTIEGLEWSDRVQEAGFMQNFVKSVNQAIEQYCDAIALGELHPTAEASATSWQGLLAMGSRMAGQANGPRDIANESCVKLCNIEYAMMKLDDIYKEMNIPELTRVLRRYRVAMGSQKENTDEEPNVKGAFKLQISYAENVKPCNKNGLANPYVIVRVPDGTIVPPLVEPTAMDNVQTDRGTADTTTAPPAPTVLTGVQCELCRSRSISDTINPNWDETFEVILPPVSKLEFAVLSKNILTADELAGKAVVDLSRGTRLRRKLADHQTHDVYVELEPQGRLMVRLTMEGGGEDVEFWFRRCKERLARARDDFVRALNGRIIPHVREDIHKCIKSHEAVPLPSQNFFTKLTASVQYSNVTASGKPIDEKVTEVEANDSLDPLIDYLNHNLSVLNDYLSPRMSQEVIRRCWDDIVNILESILVPPLFGPIEASRRVLNRRQVSMASFTLQLLKSFFHAGGDGVVLKLLESRKYNQVVELLEWYALDVPRLKKEYEQGLLRGRDREGVLRLVRVKVEKALEGEERDEGRKWVESMLIRRKEVGARR